MGYAGEKQHGGMGNVSSRMPTRAGTANPEGTISSCRTNEVGV